MGARRRNLRLARGSAKYVCLRAHRCLHHAPPRPHTRPGTLTTPLHATTLHSHLLPAHTPAPHRHLCFGYKMPVRHVLLSLASGCGGSCCREPLRTARPSTSTQTTPLTPAHTQPPHALAKYTQEPWLYPPSPLTKECSSVGRAQAPDRLASRWCPFFRSTLQTV